jgi:hypothetical protein
MKKYNINSYMYIQITDEGWKHLKKTVSENYIEYSIESPSYKKIINGEVWYRLQCWDVFNIFPVNMGGAILFNTNVMFEDNELISIF